MKAHKLVVTVIDQEGYGVEEYRTIIEQHRHLNGRVIATETIEIGAWGDDHPLNLRDTDVAEYFRKAKENGTS
jgi:hypothetical protein